MVIASAKSPSRPLRRVLKAKVVLFAERKSPWELSIAAWKWLIGPQKIWMSFKGRMDSEPDFAEASLPKDDSST